MDGEVVDLMGASPRHDGLISALGALLSAHFSGIQHVVREEKTLLLTEYFAPLPDIAVVSGVYEDYLERFPSAKDVLLVVELADSSLEYDRSKKLAAYATAGIQEYWIINLRQDQVEIYCQPAGEVYLVTQIAKIGEAVRPLVKSARPIEVAALFGRR